MLELAFFKEFFMTKERLQKMQTVLSKRQNDITIVLENVFDPHNVSAVMRSCDAIGVSEMYVLNSQIPQQHKWGFRSSSSAFKWLTIHQFTDTKECFKVIRNKYQQILTTHLGSDVVSLYELNLTSSIALVFGNEHDGVSEEARCLADGNFIIPQAGMIRSLNISVACAVALYEAYRQKQAAGHYLQQKLSDAEYNLLINQWRIINNENAV